MKQNNTKAVWRKQMPLIAFVFFVLFFLLLLPGPTAQAASPKYAVKIGRKILFVGEKQQIQTKGKKIRYTFKSSNKKVLSVSKKGLLKAKKKGKARITVTARWKVKGKIRTKTKTYRIQVKTLKLKAKSAALPTGSSTQIRLNNNTGSRNVSLYSSNPQVAQVNGMEVTGILPGQAVITVQVGDYFCLYFSVEVSARDLGTVYYQLLVNQTGINSTLDLDEIMSQTAGSKGVCYRVSDPAKGEVSGGVYRVRDTGTNTVEVYGGGGVMTFSIRGWRWAAHRGYLDMRPENTMDAFITAGTSGAAMVETDIRVTSDGTLVCLHNATVNHMTDGTGSVKNITYEELRELCIDNGNGVSEANDRYIPTFAQYLQVMKRFHMIAVIELKSWGNPQEVKENAMRDLYRQICAYGMQDQCILISYYASQFELFVQVNGDTGIPLGALSANCLSKARQMGLPNLSTSHGTRLGAYSCLDYSPILGRKNLPWQSY